MKVLHVIPSLTATDGGPTRAVLDMAHALELAGVQAHIATTTDDSTITTGQLLQRDGCNVIHFPLQTQFYKISLGLRQWLGIHACDYDVVHVHALFSFAPSVTARACVSSGVPYIVRPLGVLNRWGMDQRHPLFKRLSFRFNERWILRKAAAIHYTSQSEADEAERFSLGTPKEIIPLGVNLTQFEVMPDPAVFRNAHPETKGRRIVLFLSRIDFKKGLDILLPAFAKLRDKIPDVMLVIAGSGDPDYEAHLRQQAVDLGISGDVLWTGFLNLNDKQTAFAAAELYVLPSHSENFGIALLEAMAAGLPCISTSGVALAMDAGDAVCVSDAEPDALTNAMSQLLDCSDELRSLAQRARKCAFAHYSMNITAQRLADLYQRISTRAMHGHP